MEQRLELSQDGVVVGKISSRISGVIDELACGISSVRLCIRVFIRKSVEEELQKGIGKRRDTSAHVRCALSDDSDGGRTFFIGL